MVFVLKHLHLTLIAGAVLMFMLRFYWVQTATGRAYSAPVMKVSGWLNGLVVLSGVLLCMVLDLNPLNNGTPWLSEEADGHSGAGISGGDGAAVGQKQSGSLVLLSGRSLDYFIAKLAVLKQTSVFG